MIRILCPREWPVKGAQPVPVAIRSIHQIRREILAKLQPRMRELSTIACTHNLMVWEQSVQCWQCEECGNYVK